MVWEVGWDQMKCTCATGQERDVRLLYATCQLRFLGLENHEPFEINGHCDGCPVSMAAWEMPASSQLPDGSTSLSPEPPLSLAIEQQPDPRPAGLAVNPSGHPLGDLVPSLDISTLEGIGGPQEKMTHLRMTTPIVPSNKFTCGSPNSQGDDIW
jgi:hypothetical protein